MTMNLRPRVAALVAVLLLSFTVFTRPAYSVNNVVFVVDGSGSMSDPFEKRPKLEIAKEALSSLVRGLPDQGINAGLVVYSGGCESSSATVPLARVNKQSLLSGIGAIVAGGKTPIASSLRLAETELRDVPGEKAVILLTDGAETCNGDPQRTARELNQKGITVHVIGFDIPKVGAARDLQTLAKLGGGSYFTAATADGLRDALTRAAEAAEKGTTETFPRVQENIQIIVDSSGDMAGPYEGRTRLALAQAALRNVLNLQHPDRDNIALGIIHGRCGLSFPKPDVPFRLNNAPSIVEQVDNLNPSGKRTLVDAVLAAIDDFNKPQFKDVTDVSCCSWGAPTRVGGRKHLS
ncbi:MAG: VWA domain-containing protein [Alphaproteobacteria bacterium]|nr:VWA domain-containing protein [Alphaproteobacteria bacterium]